MFRGYQDRNGKIIMDKEYLDHPVFVSVVESADFYRNLSDNVMSFVTMWVKSQTIINYDSYFFGAVANSIDSIKAVLTLGHVSDARTLLRSLFDEMVVNLYFTARLRKKGDECNRLMTNDNGFVQDLKLEELYDANVSDWLADNKTKSLKAALRYDEMKKFLCQEARLIGIVEYLESDECKKMREWLNDAVHLNHYKSILLNDGLLCLDDLRKATLDELKRAFDKITMFHITCMFCLSPVYMMSSDYLDYKECGMEPPEGCQYEVSPFIQSYLDKTVYKLQPRWAIKMVEKTGPMRLRVLDCHNNG